MAIEPKRPRKPTFDYHVKALPEEIFAIVRVSWYCNGKADEVDETTLFEADDAYEAFTALVGTSLRQGANVSVQSGYQPADLGILQ